MRAFLCFLVAIVALPALAQDAFDLRIADVALLQQDPVKKEIGISDAQRDAMNLMASNFNATANKRGEALSKNNPQLTPQELLQDTEVSEALRKMRTGVLSLLSPSQLKRLREITVQLVGPRLLGTEDVGNRIGVSADTRKKVVDLYSKAQQDVGKLVGDAQRDTLAPFQDKQPANEAEQKAMQEQFAKAAQEADKTLQPKVKARVEKADKDAVALLTADQKAKWEALKGKKFAF